MREIAHQLNNYLGVIITYSELAREALPDNHPAASDMTEIGEAARQAVAIVNTLTTPPASEK